MGAGKKVEFKLSLPGLNAVMKSEGMQAHLQAVGEAVANAAGAEYAADTHVAGFVAIANVYPNSKAAAHDNYTNNTLERALGAVGLRRTKK